MSSECSPSHILTREFHTMHLLVANKKKPYMAFRWQPHEPLKKNPNIEIYSLDWRNLLIKMHYTEILAMENYCNIRTKINDFFYQTLIEAININTILDNYK